MSAKLNLHRILYAFDGGRVVAQKMYDFFNFTIR
jgi:hypothetical protein